jgi:small conductance mechanosensitive channel
MSFDISKYLSMAVDTVITYAPNLIGGMLVLLVGFWIGKKISKITNKGLGKFSLSLEITSFLVSMFDMVLKFAVILFAAGIAGFDISAIVAFWRPLVLPLVWLSGEGRAWAFCFRHHHYGIQAL